MIFVVVALHIKTKTKTLVFQRNSQTRLKHKTIQMIECNDSHEIQS
jgi:hypothetical protein